jgi:hypothetical protein
MGEIRISIKDMFRNSKAVELMSAAQLAERTASERWGRQLERNAAKERGGVAAHPPDSHWTIAQMLGLTDSEGATVQRLANFERMSNTFRGVSQRTGGKIKPAGPDVEFPLRGGETKSDEDGFGGSVARRSRNTVRASRSVSREEVFRNLGIK